MQLYFLTTRKRRKTKQIFRDINFLSNCLETIGAKQYWGGKWGGRGSEKKH